MTSEQSPLKFHVSRFTFLCALCCILQQVRAAGSWVVDGQVVQTLEVETSNDDPAALHTDGSRKMEAPLEFDDALSSPVSGLFKAYVPWDAQYDFFAFDSSRESIILSPTIPLGFEAGELAIYSGRIEQIGDDGIVDLDQRRLAGGWWLQDVLDDPKAIITRQFSDNRYIRSAVSNEHVSIYCFADDPQGGARNITFRSNTPGAGDASVIVDPEDGLVVEHRGDVAARIKASSIILGTSYTETDLRGTDVWVDMNATEPTHVLNLRTAENRFVRSAVSNELVSIYGYHDDPDKTLTKIILGVDAPEIGATSVIIDPEDGIIINNDGYIAARIKASSIQLGTSFTETEINGELNINADATSGEHALNLRTADNRFVLKSSGISTNYTVTVGDVLQIQNGVITAINP